MNIFLRGRSLLLIISVPTNTWALIKYVNSFVGGADGWMVSQNNYQRRPKKIRPGYQQECTFKSNHIKERKRKQISGCITILFSSPGESSFTGKNFQGDDQKARKRSSRKSKQFNSFSWNTALAIVPPEEGWDQIQRARHFAGDKTYSVWPPAIRLFHPYINEDIDTLQDSALDIARQVIEKYKIEPFPIVLSRWSIVPQSETLVVEMTESSNTKAKDELSENVNGDQTTPMLSKQRQQDRKVQELIAREEQIGKEKFSLRREKQHQQKEIAKENVLSGSLNAVQRQHGVEPNNQQPQKLYDEFNGPCVLCLEPDNISQLKLQELRRLLVHELFQSHEKCCSPSSLYVTDTTIILNQFKKFKAPTSSRKKKAPSVDFRPVVPIASFPTVDSAIPVARKLRSTWQPIQFNVTDLQIMSSSSYGSAESNSFISDSNSKSSRLGEDQDVDDETSHSEYERDRRIGGKALYGNVKNREFGCDALIALIGEEVEMDDELNQEIVTTLLEKGEKGGYELLFLKPQQNDDCNGSNTIQRSRGMGSTRSQVPSQEGKGIWTDTEQVPDLSSSSPYLEQWLDEDDEDFDEGTVVVIGRTHLLTGAMRQYVGMPASSTLLDHKTRSSGSNNNKRRPTAGTNVRDIADESGDTATSNPLL